MLGYGLIYTSALLVTLEEGVRYGLIRQSAPRGRVDTDGLYIYTE